MSKKLLTVAQVADLLGVTPKSIRLWVTEGKIPFRRIGNRSLRFDADDLEKWSQRRGKTVEEIEQAIV